MKHHTKRLTLLLALCLTLSVAGSASAQDLQSGDDGYLTGGENVAGQVQGGSQGGGGSDAPAAATETSGSSLPFTGVDLALMLGVGGLLLAVGLGTRRLTRPADAA